MSLLRIDYVRAVGKACKYQNEFEHILQIVAPSTATILTNIKSQDSYFNKLQRKGNDPTQVHDVLRAAILTETKEEVQKVVDNIVQFCYDSNGIYKVYDVDFKDSPTPIGYYGSCHIKIQIHDQIYEIQIMPKELWAAKETTHSFYKTIANNNRIDPSIKRFSNQIFDIAHKSYE